MARVPTRRLSTVDTLPDGAVPALQKAFDAIRERRQTQLAILRRLNDDLSALGAPVVSASAFNRYTMAVRCGERERPTATRKTEHSAGLDHADLAEGLENLREATDRVSRLLRGSK